MSSPLESFGHAWDMAAGVDDGAVFSSCHPALPWLFPVDPAVRVALIAGNAAERLIDGTASCIAPCASVYATMVSSERFDELAYPSLNDGTVFQGVSAVSFYARRAIMIARHRRRYAYDPRSGEALVYDSERISATSGQRPAIFPRLDPAVIGLVVHAITGNVLLGSSGRRRNAAGERYYSLIAGYVDPGESIEQAFAREVWEEAGRMVENVRYVESQPWPPSGSLMFGMIATTCDDSARTATDGELVDTIWVSRDAVRERRFNGPRPGSLAERLLGRWAAGELL